MARLLPLRPPAFRWLCSSLPDRPLADYAGTDWLSGVEEWASKTEEQGPVRCGVEERSTARFVGVRHGSWL